MSSASLLSATHNTIPRHHYIIYNLHSSGSIHTSSSPRFLRRCLCGWECDVSSGGLSCFEPAALISSTAGAQPIGSRRSPLPSSYLHLSRSTSHPKSLTLPLSSHLLSFIPLFLSSFLPFIHSSLHHLGWRWVFLVLFLTEIITYLSALFISLPFHLSFSDFHFFLLHGRDLFSERCLSCNY